MRWVLHPENAEDVNPAPLLAELAGDVARDAKRLVAKRTGRTAASIEVTSVSRRRATVHSKPKNPESNPGHQEYGFWLERGTSDTDAQPHLRPATYRYRS